ncbi:MAG: YdcH family protein [Pseudomonadota bacterium]
MSVISYRLLTVHRRLDDEIRAQRSRRWPDVAKIQRLKKLKLAVKDRLHQLAISRPSLRTA